MRGIPHLAGMRPHGKATEGKRRAYDAPGPAGGYGRSSAGRPLPRLGRSAADYTAATMTARLRNPLTRDLRECEEVRALMSDYLDGDLPKKRRFRVTRHLLFCRPCRRVLANLRRTVGRLRGLSSSPPPQAQDEALVAERVLEAWRKKT